MTQLLQHDHLLPEIRAILNKPLEERIGAIDRDIYIPYSRAEQILSRMERLYSRSSTGRPPGLLISAPSGNGKSTIRKVFVKRHQTEITPEADIRSVLAVEAPPVPGERRLLGAIIIAFGVDAYNRDDVEARMARVMKYLKFCQVRLMIIDEIHNLLAGSHRQIEETCNLIKYLSNRVSVVLIGTERAENVVRSDPQLLSRFPIVTLPAWRDGTPYRNFLCLLERTIPLHQASNLAGDEKASYILQHSHGILGDIVSVVKDAAVSALLDGAETITMNHLKNPTFSSQKLAKATSSIVPLASQ